MKLSGRGGRPSEAGADGGMGRSTIAGALLFHCFTPALLRCRGEVIGMIAVFGLQLARDP